MNVSSLTTVLIKNDLFLEEYTENNALMKLIDSDLVADKNIRIKLLDCLQVFSDYFQRVVILRSALTDDIQFLHSANEHLAEEYGHNLSLLKDRNNKAAIWDPILEASASWFAWKMLTLDNPGKTLLVHLVLESSANAFFKKAHAATEKYNETNYFKIHAIVDESHQNMGTVLLNNLTEVQYRKLLELQQKGWDMLNTVCNRIAHLTVDGNVHLIPEKAKGINHSYT